MDILQYQELGHRQALDIAISHDVKVWAMHKLLFQQDPLPSILSKQDIDSTTIIEVKRETYILWIYKTL